eukprot:1594141-Rhodomonas_salina.4
MARMLPPPLNPAGLAPAPAASPAAGGPHERANTAGADEERHGPQGVRLHDLQRANQVPCACVWGSRRGGFGIPVPRSCAQCGTLPEPHTTHRKSHAMFFALDWSTAAS